MIVQEMNFEKGKVEWKHMQVVFLTEGSEL